MKSSSIVDAKTARTAQTAADRASAEHLGISIISESYRCQYPSKHCANDRSMKRDGDLHKFCEFHRSKANRNQRKLEQKKKLESMKSTLSPRHQLRIDTLISPSLLLTQVHPIDGHNHHDGGDDGDHKDALWDLLLPVDLDDTDIQALAAMIESAMDN